MQKIEACVQRTTDMMRRQFLELPGNGSAFEERMASVAKHAGLLPPVIRYTEGKRIYCYETTGLVPFSAYLKGRSLSAGALGGFVLQLHAMVRCLEQHLLEERNLLLDEENVLADPELGLLKICVVPGHRADFCEQAGRLLQKMVCSADLASAEAMRIGIMLLQRTSDGGYNSAGLADLLLSVQNPVQVQGSRTGQTSPVVTEYGGVRSEMQADSGQRQYAQSVSSGHTERVPETQQVLRREMRECGSLPDTDSTYLEAESDVYRASGIDRFDHSEKEETQEETAQNEAEATERSDGEQPVMAGAGLRILVSLLMLTAAMAVVALLRGLEAALRFLPLYGLMAAGIAGVILVRAAFERKRHSPDDMSK